MHVSVIKRLLLTGSTTQIHGTCTFSQRESRGMCVCVCFVLFGGQCFNIFTNDPDEEIEQELITFAGNTKWGENCYYFGW